MQDYEYIDRAPLEIDDVIEITDELLSMIGGGHVSIWF